MYTMQQIMLALQMLSFFLAKVPGMIEAFERGEEEQLNWEALLPRGRDELEAEVDEQGEAS